MPNHMDRLTAMVNVRGYVDTQQLEPDETEVVPGFITLKDLRDIVNPTTAEDVR